MSLWGRLGRALGRAGGPPKPEDPVRTIAAPFFWIPSGMRLSDQEATSVSVVWACIQAISTAMASSPWNVFEVTGQRRTIKPDDRLSFILNQRASTDITAVAFREAMMFGALSSGNAYAAIITDGAGRVEGLMPLHPECMIVTRDADGALLYVYRDPQGGGDVYLDPAKVFHLRGPVSISGLLGDSIIARASKAIALSASVERYSLSYFANGTLPTGVLKYPARLDDKAMVRIREQWAEKMTGPKAGGKPVILEGGMEYSQISADPDKAQAIGLSQWSTEAIARYFGVPLVLLNVQAAAVGYGSNISQLMTSFTRGTLAPWRLRLEQEANAKLVRGPPYRETVIDLDWLARGDAKEQAETDEIRIRSGVYSVNEIRSRLSGNSIGKEGDLRFVSTQLQPLTDTLLDIQEKAAGPDPVAPMKASGPAPAADSADVQDTSEDPTGAEAMLLRRAIQVSITQQLVRLEQRIEKRERDLRRQGMGAAKIAENIAAERTKAREWVLEQCKMILDLARDAAALQGRHMNGEADQALLVALDELAKTRQPEDAARSAMRLLLPEDA